jgi:hypothetical protein
MVGRGVRVWVPNTHDKCSCNVRAGVLGRLLAEAPVPTKVGLKKMARGFQFVSHLLRRETFGQEQLPWSFEQVLEPLGGTKRRRFERAAASLVVEGLCERDDARVAAFVKADKYDFLSVGRKLPRIISARRPLMPRYNMELAQYLKPLEHALYHIAGSKTWGVRPTRIVAKGLNQRQRASLLLEKFQGFSRGVAIIMDGSHFDRHVSKEQLKLTHRVYLRLMDIPRFRTLLSWQLKNKARTASGARFSCSGKRMTGDMDTALGNCIIMIAMMIAAMQTIGVKKFDLLDDGDDCILFVEECDVARIRKQIQGIFRSFGHSLKVECVALSPEQVDFCQTRLVQTADGAKMLRHPDKVLGNACASHRHYQTLRSARSMMLAVGHGELALGLGCPVYQALGLALIRKAGNVKPYSLDPSGALAQRVRREVGGLKQAAHLTPVPVTPEARSSFERAFGWSLATQLSVESELLAWSKDELDMELPCPEEWMAIGPCKSPMLFVGTTPVE